MLRFMKLAMIAYAVCATCGVVVRAAGVVKDHVSDAAAWAEDVGGTIDHFIDPDPNGGAVAGIAFTGTGERLTKVGILWTHGSILGEPNGGDINELRWRFRFFPDTSSFSLGAMYSPAPNPNWEAVFDAPFNADWGTVIGTVLGFALRYAEVDVSALNIATVPGQTHIAVLAPESRLESPETIAAIAMSGGGGTTVGTESDWYERGAYDPVGPDSLANLREDVESQINWSYVAGKVTVAAIIHVTTTGSDANDGRTWATAKQTVQAALNSAASGEQVWVAAGTYVENITLKDGVELYGGFAGTEAQLAERDFRINATILDGNQTGSVLTVPAGATLATRIDGFTIRNGSGTLVSGPLRYGGGIDCVRSSPTIVNNTLTQNTAYGGGGVCCYISSSPTITDNTITENTGSGIFCVRSSPTITNNTIVGNSNTTGRSGGGVYCSAACSPTIANNTIAENSAADSGGGIYCAASDCAPTITNNTISRNTAGQFGGGISCLTSLATLSNNRIVDNETDWGYGGGIYCESASPTIANNTINGNLSAGGGGIYCYLSSPTIANNMIMANGQGGGCSGGGIFCDGSSPTIANNTIVANDAYWGAGILSLGSSLPVVANTIVAFNSSGIASDGEGLVSLRDSCVHGNGKYNYSGLTDPTGSNGNISTDPLLANAPYGNAHLKPSSPCIGTGDDTIVQGGWKDIDDQPRVQGGHVDIGADESDGTAWPEGPHAIVRVSPSGGDANDGSSWTSAKRTVQAAIDAVSGQGGDVWVKAGVYLERVMLPSYVHMYGGFSGTETEREQRNWRTSISVLDGESAGSVIRADRPGYALGTIDGFLIRHGRAYLGGGICGLNASPRIANNTIIGNVASEAGGGIWALDSVITNNIITGNTASYGGGGIAFQYSSPIIANNIVAGNTAMSGGGINFDPAEPTLVNNTITGNVASWGGGGLCSRFESVLTMTNNIVAFNSSGIYDDGTGTVGLQSNCVYGNTAYDYSGVTDPTGTDGNVSTDPRFVRPAAPGIDGQWATADDDYGDLRLQITSPCIDAGRNDDVPSDITIDFGGRPRLVDNPSTPDTGAGTPPIVDMGAYEYQPTAAADFNDDLTVDAVDLQIFAACATGPAIPYAASPPTAGGCSLWADNADKIPADLDKDGDVDMVDFGTLQRCYGVNGPEAADCGQ